MSHTTRTNIEICDSLSSLVDKIANIEIQMSVLHSENEDLKNKMANLNKRIKDLESAPAKPSTPRPYSAVAGASLPPRPQPTITTTTNTATNSGNKKQDPKPVKILQSLYPRASREIIVAFSNVDTLVTGQMVEDRALESVNNAIAKIPINKRFFHSALFSLASSLVLTTGLHETNEDLDDYLDVNIYSHGGRDTACAELIKTFTPDESSILIGGFNCHHPWWYGNIKSTKNHMKTRQLSANAKDIVDWLESQNYKLHNKPGIETHYPRGPKEKSPAVIDLCFSRGEISNSIDTWMINHDSTSDHSIIGIRIIRLEIRLSSPIKGKYIRAWSKAN
jgi:hypothetical protein